MKVLIIGHGPGGMTASGTLRIWDRNAEITNIDTKDFDLYHPCATPYVIGGKFKDLGNSDAIKEHIPYEKMKIKHLHRHLVEKIDRAAKKVQVKNLNTNERFELEYDKIILATGSYNTSPPIPGVKEGKNVFSLKWLEEAEEIRLAAEKAKKVVVIGASAIALEVGCELAERGLDVTIFVRSRVLRQSFDPDYSKLIVDLLSAKLPEHLTIKVGENVKEVVLDENGMAYKVITTNDEELETDFVFAAAGVKAETSLAKDAGLEIGVTGGLKVDKYLQTSDPDIIGIGDCTETVDLVRGDPLSSMLATCAVHMGRIAAYTIAKPGEVEFPGTLNNFIVPFVDLNVGSIGYNIVTAEEKYGEGNVLSVKIKTTDRPHYMPEAREIYFKVLVVKETGKIVGAQGIGYNLVTDNLNIVSIAIQADMTYKQLLEADLCYAPAINETIYPVTQALEMVARRLLRKR